MNTLALNIIVAPGEATLLDRCLDSVEAQKNFDEIVIINTSLRLDGTVDLSIDEVARKYGAKVIHHIWASKDFPHGNFAEARNKAIDNSSSDFIMWLDSDDAIFDDQLEQFQRAIATIKSDEFASVEVCRIPYVVDFDLDFNPISTFYRERVFKRKVCRWENSIHEQLTPEWGELSTAQIDGIYVAHLPIKHLLESADRNIKMLEHEIYTRKNDSVKLKYFLGRDLLLSNHTVEGHAILSDLVFGLALSFEMMYSVCTDLAFFYAYGMNSRKPRLSELIIENVNQAMKWARLAISFNTMNAEPYVLLGDIYYRTQNYRAAERMYRAAFKKNPLETKKASLPFYKEIPFARLSGLYVALGDFDQALFYNKQALEENKVSRNYIQQRHQLLVHLIQEFNEKYGMPVQQPVVEVPNE